MGVRITGGNPRPLYPRVEVGCMNTKAHEGYKIVHFVIPAGRKSKKCPECGRRAGRD